MTELLKEGITPSKPVTSKPPQGGSGISGDSKENIRERNHDFLPYNYSIKLNLNEGFRDFLGKDKPFKEVMFLLSMASSILKKEEDKFLTKQKEKN